ncbi:MAG: efflux RND transporter permease subunit [Pirellulales bacterium]
MKALIQWAVRNTPAMNTLMVAGMFVGAITLWKMHREVFPEFDLEILLVSVPYPGASPDEVEEGICQKIEEAVRAIEGIKKQTSVAQEGAGFVVIELESDVKDVQKILNEVRSEVDRIPSFPLFAEDPEVKQITLRQPVIRVGVLGPDCQGPECELQLRAVAERVRDDLLQQPAVSQAEILGAREFQIDIEISEETLRKHGLTLIQVAEIIRRENLELPGGTMRTEAGEVLLRGKNKRSIGEEIAELPLVTTPEGTVLRVNDLGQVRDEFDDTITSFSRINGRPGLVISVERTSSEDLLAMVADVRNYVKTNQLPNGYTMAVWGDQSIEVRNRLQMLANNGLQGLILVFLLLAVFLELRLAFWVAIGIPIAILGTCAVLYFTGQTMNMLTSFAFLMVLGILVDDAIVIGENVYAHREAGKNFLRAAIDGTIEVIPSVTTSVATTVIAFMPMFYVSGVMGKFIAVMPLAVVAALLISLFEAAFILPCHLAHPPGSESLLERMRRWRAVMSLPLRLTLGNALVGLAVLWTHLCYPFKRMRDAFVWSNGASNRLLDGFIKRFYAPLLRWSIDHVATTLALAATVMLISLGLVASGLTPFIVFPKIDSNQIEARIVYPDGTPAAVTIESTARMERAMQQLNEKYSVGGEPLVEVLQRSVGQVSAPGAMGPDTRTTGSNVGGVSVELIDTAKRTVRSQQIIAEWRQLSGDFPGAETISFGAQNFGPGGRPIEFKLLADATKMDELEAAVDETKARLGQFAGVYDISDDSRPGKWEYQLRIKPRAMAMGIPLADLAETVRASYYGEEVMRLQRGRHEVKLMVRYPRSERRSMADFEEIRIRTVDGSERPILELADVDVQRGYSEINRIDQMRSITITADVDESLANAYNIVQNLRTSFMPDLLRKYDGLRVRWEGQQEQTTESMESLRLGLLVALVAMFVLLTMEFRSYLQPLMILAIIPFGVIGAIWGHFLQGRELTMFSVFGLVALTGVVVNDAIVLIDFINHRVRDGVPLKEALIDASSRRLRPVFLTSVTTVAGLLPILLERSFQAQIVIPMATSLCFGLMASTVIVLVLVPSLYYVYARLTGQHQLDEILASAEDDDVDSETASDLDDATERVRHAVHGGTNGNGGAHREPTEPVEHGSELVGPVKHGA